MKIEEIRLMNETRIAYLKKTNQSTARNQIVQKILEDEACFFKMSKEDSIIILEDIGVSKSNLESIYKDIISKINYYELEKQGKIKKEDKEIIIKYEEKDIEEVFKERKEKTDKNTNIKIEDEKKITTINNKVSIFRKIINKIKNFFK